MLMCGWCDVRACAKRSSAHGGTHVEVGQSQEGRLTLKCIFLFFNWPSLGGFKNSFLGSWLLTRQIILCVRKRQLHPFLGSLGRKSNSCIVRMRAFGALCVGLLALGRLLTCQASQHNSTQPCERTIECPKCEGGSECRDSPFFRCRDGSFCLPFPGIKSKPNSCAATHQRFCDGFRDCDDGSDEINSGVGFKCLAEGQITSVAPRKCVLPQEYLARWNRTEVNLPDFTVCAQEADRCFTHADSAPVFDTSRCWPCIDGTLIRRGQVCDGVIDCADSSDEHPCFGLRNDTSVAYDRSWECTSNRSNATRCNGVFECKGGEDECDCERGRPPMCRHINALGRIRLGSCEVDAYQLCNGFIDCPGGKDEDISLCPNRVLCDPNNASMGNYDNRNRCDLESNCPNSADELNCSKHFYCDQEPHGGKFTYINRSRVGNGRPDCRDFSDECHAEDALSSPKHLIALNIITAWLWLMCLLSLFGNAAVATNTVLELISKLRRPSFGHAPNRILLGHKLFILNLAVADFLMGVYLLVLGVLNITFGDKYCKQRWAWVSSTGCAALGVLANVSSQLSVLILAGMTAYRLYGITCPFNAKTIRCRYVAATIFFLWVVAIVVALLPLQIADMSEYAIDQPYLAKPKLTYPELRTIVDKAMELSDRNGTGSENVTEEFCRLFPAACESQIVEIGYYGSDGVCLPRFYDKLDDTSARYTLALVVFDSSVMVFMVVAYLIISCETASASKPLTGTPRNSSDIGQADLRARENDAIWGRIVRLIASNVICWLPICVTSFAFHAGVAIPPKMYTVTAAILIPVNSALDPWIYSNFLVSVLRKVALLCRRKLRKATDLELTKKPDRSTPEPYFTIELVAMRTISLDAAFSPRSFGFADVNDAPLAESTSL